MGRVLFAWISTLILGPAIFLALNLSFALTAIALLSPGLSYLQDPPLWKSLPLAVVWSLLTWGAYRGLRVLHVRIKGAGTAPPVKAAWAALLIAVLTNFWLSQVWSSLKFGMAIQKAQEANRAARSEAPVSK